MYILSTISYACVISTFFAFISVSGVYLKDMGLQGDTIGEAQLIIFVSGLLFGLLFKNITHDILKRLLTYCYVCNCCALIMFMYLIKKKELIMNDVRYQIAFTGKLRPGFGIEQVKARLQKHLKLSSTVVESLFAKDRVVIKKNLSADAAKQYEQRFYTYGAIVKLEKQVPSTIENQAKETREPANIGPDKAQLPLEPIAEPAAGPKDTESAAVVRPVINSGRSTTTTNETVSVDNSEYPKALAFEFTGNGREYFKIWIVNIALTILTLGIYSAWAKVRNKQYFYGNTLFDGSSFEYTAKPLTILKGRILAFAIIAFYYILSSILPPAFAIGFYFAVFVAVIFLLPWVAIKALQFNARHSQYRNINFGFDGDYRGAFKAFILWPMASIIPLLLPFTWQRKNRFFVDNSRYGTTPFQFTARVGDYYGLFGKMILLGIGLTVIVSVLFGFGVGVSAGSEGLESPAAIVGIVVSMIGYAAAYFIAIAFYNVASNNLLYNSTLLEEHSFSANYRFGSYALLLLTNTLGIVLTLGLFIPWALIRSARYHAENTQFIATESLDSFIAGETQKTNTLSEGLADAHSVFDLDVGI